MEPCKDVSEEEDMEARNSYLETCDVAVMSLWQDRGRSIDRRICVTMVCRTHEERS
jgi:hypothetical protein